MLDALASLDRDLLGTICLHALVAFSSILFLGFALDHILATKEPTDASR